MKIFNSLNISFWEKRRLKALLSTSNPLKPGGDLENLILNELLGFAEKNRNKKFVPKSLILDVKKSAGKQSPWIKLELLVRIYKTRGQLRWLCFYFYSPVLSDAFQISRGKLFRSIFSNWSRFSSEVLSRIYLVKGETAHFERISLDLFSNPNADFSLNAEVSYVLESEYSAQFAYMSYKSFLRKYTLGRIVLWRPDYAINLIESSDRLLNSQDIRDFINTSPHFKELIESRVKLKFRFHPNSGYALDHRIDRQRSNLPDRIDKAEIWHQRFILSEGELLLIDSTCSPRLDFVAGHWQFLEQIELLDDHVRLKKPRGFREVNLEEAIFLMGRVDENWYHLLLDTLPRYSSFRDVDRDVPVLVRSDLPSTSIDLLRQLITRTLIFIEPNDKVSVGLLHFVAGRSTVFDSKPLNGEDRVHFSPTALALTRKWILETVTESHELDFPKKFFITRKSKYRNLINSKKVMEMCRVRNYEIVDCTNQFFLNQSFYFANASHIISPGGAVLANILFMQPGSEITIIRSSRESDLQLWEKLAFTCGIEFSEVVGIPTYYGRKSLAREHSDYLLPLSRIEKFLHL
jgi:hypothetical protein